MFKCIYLGLLIFCINLHAVTSTWILNGNGDWTDGANWDTDPVFPNAAGDEAIFDTFASITVTVPTTIDIGTITKNASSGFFSITGIGDINLHTGITINAASSLIFFNELVLQNDVIIDIPAVILAGNVSLISDDGGGRSITKNGGGIYTFTGTSSNTYTGMTAVNSGRLTLSKSSGVVAIPGDISLSGGGVTTSNSNQFANTSNVTINSGTFDMGGTEQTMASLTFNGGSVIGFSNNLNLVGAGTVLTMRNRNLPSSASSGTVILGGDVLFDATSGGTATIMNDISLGATDRTFDIQDGGSSIDMSISGDISGVGGLVKEGAGRLNISGNNSYMGTTLVTSGELSLNSSGTAIPGDVTIDGGTLTLSAADQIANSSTVILNTGGEMNLNNNNETIGSLIFNSGGLISNVSTLTLSSTGTALTLQNITMNGNISLTGASGGAVVFDETNNGTAEIVNINLGNVARTFNIGSGTGNPDMSVTGVISGTAGLSKSGAGTLDLSEANTYTGTTTIDAGILQISDLGTLGNNSPLTINGGSFVIAAGAGAKTIGALNGGGSGINLNDNTLNVPSGTFSGVITGTGNLNKTTTGTLTLSGASTLTGGTATVTDGTLSITGTLTATQIDVNGGILGGTGTINANVLINSGGTVAPGASIGTLVVNGPYTQGMGSTLFMEIDDAGNSDLLRVNGGLVTIEPGATLEFDPLPGVYLPGTSYLIIDSDVAIVGSFDTIVFTVPGLRASIEQNSDLILTLLEIGGFIELESMVTGNAQKVAFCLNDRAIEPGSDLEVIGTALQPITSSQRELQNALDQMQPAIFGALNIIQESQAILLQSAFIHRMEAWGNGLCGTLSPNTWNVWVSPVAEFIDQQSDGQNVGYTSKAYGAIIGADQQLGKYFHWGLAASYVHDDVHWKRSRGKAYSHNAYGSLYAFWQQKKFHVLFSFLGGWNDYHGWRNIQFTTLNRKAKHENTGTVFGGQFEIAYSINRLNTRIQPFGRAQYLYSTQRSYHEHGAGDLDLKVKRKNSDRFRSDLGLDFSQCFKVRCGQIVPNIYVSWVWEDELENGNVKAAFFKSFDCSMTVQVFRPIRSLFAP